MNRGALLLVASLVACGGSKPKQQNLAPLPDDKPPVEAKKEEEKKPDPVPEALPPLAVKLDVPAAAVKLVNAGKGKKAPLKYAAKPGAKQALELVMTFSQTAAANGQSDEQGVPSIVLTGEAETKAVDASGKTEYRFAVASFDARANSQSGEVDLQKFKTVLGTLSALVISGTLDPNGVMNDTTLSLEKPDQYSAAAIDLFRTTLPIWPLLPAEPVGTGAKWQVTRTVMFKPSPQAPVGVETVHTTEYELVGKKGTTWTIKSKTKVSGKDQELHGAKISKIAGTGTSEIALEDGGLYPTFTSSLDWSLQVSGKNPQTGKDESEQHGFKVAGQVTAKAAGGGPEAKAEAPTK